MTLKIASFNVNSIKMRLENVFDFLKTSKIDIILMQETKTIDENFPYIDFNKKGFEITFCGQKSYNGIAIASKFKIEEISRNLPYYDEIIEDNQARFIHVKINNINVICIYLPNGNPAPGEKYDYKISWMKRLINYSREIYEKNEPVIIGGDFNVIQSEIDCFDLSKWTNDALYLEPTRKKMKELINIGFIDSFRLMHPHVKDYSFWDYQGGSWQKDNGIRIDFFLISPEIVDRLLFAGIDKNPRGKEKPSDHTPIWIELKDK